MTVRQDESQFIRIVNSCGGAAERCIEALNVGVGGFYLCLAGTATSDVEGISAAGATPALRRLTPASDAEALILGRTENGESLPVSPIGIVSPVVITRACLKLLDIQPIVVDCGTFIRPSVPFIEAGDLPANCVSTGLALPPAVVLQLYQLGLKQGKAASEVYDYIVVSECVPGGTTTASAVLTALGYNVYGCMSSSQPTANHDARWQLVVDGLARSGLSSLGSAADPFKAIAAVGDPMQAYATGFAVAASQKVPVILAGGSQMICVYAIVKAIAVATKQSPGQLAVATTKWVAFDKSAKTCELSQSIQAPFAAACPNFHNSRHPGLRAYEQGNVKEGVGAGAAMALAYANQIAAATILSAIDDTYDELVRPAFVG